MASTRRARARLGACITTAALALLAGAFAPASHASEFLAPPSGALDASGSSQPTPPRLLPPSQADLDVAVENLQIAAARSTAGWGDERGAEAALLARLSPWAQTAPGVALARRAAGVCGWLQNDNEHARAARLAQFTEEDAADRVERLYWEAWLEGHVLEHRARALELLQAARAIAPDDPRLLEDALRWADALAEFGR